MTFWTAHILSMFYVQEFVEYNTHFVFLTKEKKSLKVINLWGEKNKL